MNNFESSEQYILGTLFSNNNLMTKALDILSPEDFYRTSHQAIYKTIMKLYRNDLNFDVFVVINNLDKEIKNNIVTKTEIMNIAAYSERETFKSHMQIVKEASRIRQIINMCNSVIKSTDESNVLIDKIQNKLIEINSDTQVDTYYTMSQAVELTLEKIEEAYNSKSGLTGIPCEVQIVDQVLNGFEKKTMNVFGARPSMGKTAFSLELIRNIKANVLYIQLDMNIEGIIKRMLGTEMQVENGRISRGMLKDEEWIKLSEISSKLAKKDNIFFYQPKNPTISKILLKAKEIKIKHGLDMIIIDHIGKIKPETKGTKYEQVTVISNELKRMAIELDLNVTALCQINRNVEAKEDKRPTLSDLRDTGAIEEDADNIAMLYRAGYYRARRDNIKIDKDILEVDFQKVRNGRVGRVNFEYRLNTQEIIQILDK